VKRAVKKSSPVFTVGKLRTILNDIQKRGIKPSSFDLEQLARMLNQTHDLFTFAVNTANKSKPAADKVRDALEVLRCVFEERQQACCAEDGTKLPSARIVEDEKRLFNQFNSFLQAMEAHHFELDMDAGLLMPHIDGWRPLAESIASAFKATMSRTNPGLKLGHSNDGPVPRFVAAVVPSITGETPKVFNVGKHLKDYARKLRQRTGTTGK
jgi:hypothetical protein